MRISKLIKLLEAYKRLHGDQHVRAYNSRGDDGLPIVEERVIFKSGNKNPVHRVVVTTERED
jgi:hypothetical protein